MSIVPTIFGAAVGMTAANYIYQWYGQQAWDVAFERSFFQLSALAVVGISLGVQAVVRTPCRTINVT